MTKTCKSCALCKQLYRRFGYEMIAQDSYLCVKNNTFTELKNYCKNRKEIAEIRKPSFERLQRAEEDIKAIAALLKNVY